MKLETDAKIKTQQWDGKGSLVEFILEKNPHRRDISGSQRAMVALEAERELAEEAEERQQQSPGRPKKGSQFSDEVYHRLEAAKALGWEQIDARVLELDDLEAELLEIDENLRRYDLTAWEQSQHIERRETLLKKKGQRAKVGDNQHEGGPLTVRGPKTTADLAAEAGMSKATYERRSKVGRDIAPATADILNAIVDLATCDLPDSPKQLEYLAKLEDKTLQTTIAERVTAGGAIGRRD